MSTLDRRHIGRPPAVSAAIILTSRSIGLQTAPTAAMAGESASRGFLCIVLRSPAGFCTAGECMSSAFSRDYLAVQFVIRACASCVSSVDAPSIASGEESLLRSRFSSPPLSACFGSRLFIDAFTPAVL